MGLKQVQWHLSSIKVIWSNRELLSFLSCWAPIENVTKDYDYSIWKNKICEIMIQYWTITINKKICWQGIDMMFISFDSW